MANLGSLTGPKFKTKNTTNTGATAVEIKATAGDVYGWNILNRHTADVFVKIYDKAAGDVNPASDVPILRIQVPATGQVVLEPITWNEICQTAISMRCVTEAVDTGTTAPATLPYIKIYYY